MNFKLRKIRPTWDYKPAQTSIAPRRLKEGDRVALVSPASPYRRQGVEEGARILRSRGLIPVFGKCSRRDRLKGLYSTTIEERAKELTWAFTEESISGIFCTTGGVGSAQLLPFLPFSVIRREPKVFVGSSDITALNNGIWAKTAVTTFNGELIQIRAGKNQKRDDARAIRDMVDLLKTSRTWGARPFKRNPYEPACIFPGETEGVVLGGNLSVLTSLLGTPYFPPAKGAVLFLEDQEITTVEFVRMLTQMEMAGVFDKVNGIVLGAFVNVPNHPDSVDPTIDEAVRSIFPEIGLPCVYGYNFSHDAINAVLPIGGFCRLDAEAGSVTFDAPLTR